MQSKTLKLIWLSVLAAICLVAPRWAKAADSLLAYCPAEAEVIIHLDIRAIVASEQFKVTLENYGEQKARNQAKFLQNLTDVDIFTDLEEAWLFGRIDEDESMVIVVRGAFNQEKLVDLVKLNETYRETTIATMTVHNWQDDGDKYGAFPADDVLIIANSRPAMEAILNAMANPAQSFLATPVGRALPQGIDDHTAWGMLIKTPDIDCDFGDFARNIDLSHVLLILDLNPDHVAGIAIAVPDRPELVDEYLKVSLGGLAAANLMKEEQEMARLVGEKLTARRSDDGTAMEIVGSLTNEEFFALLEKAM